METLLLHIDLVPAGSSHKVDEINTYLPTDRPIEIFLFCFCLFLLQSSAQPTASCGSSVRSWKGNLTPSLWMNQNWDTLNKMKAGKEERGEKSETSWQEVARLPYAAEARWTLTRAFKSAHNQALDLPLREHQRDSDRVDFYKESWSQTALLSL